MAVFIGTSGWAYKEWKPDFYPPDVPQKRFLDHYATKLSACEVNATFYRPQSEDVLRRWIDVTPDDFRFAVKAQRAVTFTKKSDHDIIRFDLLDMFLESVKILRPQLGPVLLQFPAFKERNDAALESAVAELPSDTQFAFEFRSDTWDSPEVAEIVARAGTICISNTDGTVPEALPPGPLSYVRLRSERYSPEARDRWKRLLETDGRARDAYGFAKHEGTPPADPFGGVGLATWFAGS